MSNSSPDPVSRSPFGDRVVAALGATPQNVIAKRVGVSPNSMSQYVRGREPGFEIGVRLAKALGVDPVWLATGAGAPNAAAGGYLSVPISDVRLAAGVAAFAEAAEQIGEMPFDRGLLRDIGRATADGLAVFIAEGDSMHPKITDGARVVVDLKDTRLREGIFAFRTGDELRIKRLRRLVDGIEVRSDNEIYPPELLIGHAADELKIIGRALWTGSVT
jgi:phage repressor protein C with HTH and peptisase S24 domain